MGPRSTTEWQSILAAVIANPDDDWPRLIAADFLEDHGETNYSEFIRVQVELDGETHYYCQADNCVMNYGSPCRILALRRREWELRAGHASDWLGFPDHVTQVEFRRGFVEVVTLPTLASWWAKCVRCDGSGVRRVAPDASFPCYCHGHGSAGIGREVVRACPVRVVKVGDKRAFEHVWGGDGNEPPSEFVWFRGAESEVYCNLPNEVFDLLPKHPHLTQGRYPTAAEADVALSAALIMLARG